MAGISLSGLASNLNTDSLISQLMVSEQRPISLLQQRESKETTKLSSWGQIKNALSSLQAAAEAMDTRDELKAFKTSVSGTAATATAGTGAVAGSYSLEITKLADVQKVKSANSYAGLTSQVVDVSGGSKTLSIKVGDKTTDIEITDKNNSLAGVRDAINASKSGVTATLVHDGDANAPYRLVLTSNETGTANAFSLSGVNELAYDAATGTGTGLTKIQAASNAEFTVDGIAVSKSSNVVTDAIQGVTLTLAATTTAGTPSKITVTSDSSSIQTKAAALVKAYNDLNSIIKVQTAYNPTTKTSGTLNGDSTARGLQAQIRSIMGGTAGSGSQNTLSALGISFQKDGSLALDSTKLQAALDNPNLDVGAIFAKDANGTGIASKLATTISGMLGTQGMVTARTDGINDTIKRLDKQIESLSTRLVNVEARYRAQFTALEKTMSSMNSTSSQLTQQLAALSSS
ncbi:MAG: flagellar filament capping protein FliD [Candidatus Dactylopiibacterium sp.]|nr:flagellar filament capping protein FliD [Candidatus Dactylopiibacterium sp.]